MMYRKRQKASLTRRTIGYVRVSTEDQAREGVSLAAQEAKSSREKLVECWRNHERKKAPVTP